LNIFYVNVIEQNAGWGAESFVNRGFIENGEKTINLDYRKNRFNLSNKFLEIPDFDVMFLQRGDNFPLELIKAVNRPKFFWASELVSRCRDQDRLLTSGLFDHIFVHTAECKRAIVKNGWIAENKLSVLLNGFDETVQYKINDVKKDIDILFVGNILPRRRLILDELKKYFNITEASVYGKEMTEYFNRAKIVLNIHAAEYSDTETRIFEALGCGSFVLSEKLSEDNPFKNGEHFVEVENLDELKEKLDYYLKNDDEREKIALRGYKEVLSKHTYTIRAGEMVDIFKKYPVLKNISALNVKRVKTFRKKEIYLKFIYNTKESLRPFKNRIIKLIRGEK
jgi:hypothetical protein